MKKFLNYLFYFSVLIFFIGFNFSDNPQGGWELQTMPDLGGKSLNSVIFLDSIIGFASARQEFDSSYILKTTNGGDNWIIIYRNFFAMEKVQFLNYNTGFACGTYLYKTTNGGYNWYQVIALSISPENLFVLNEDTIWIISSDPITGGVFRTTNGGLNWTQQLSAGNQNPDKIYMYNARIGFIVNTSGNYNLRKTTNGGESWFTILNSFYDDIYFIDSLIGWRSWGSNFFKTTNGGLNWNSYQLPQGVNIITSSANSISVINEDTIWASGSVYWYGSKFRGIVMRSTNSCINWCYQIPNTSYQIPRYYHIQFFTNKIGWSYCISNGIHTTTGGDTTFYTGIVQLSGEVPVEYSLGQNYPNPFNSRTVIEYEIRKQSKIKITVYDITGKGIICLVDHTQSAGKYQVDFPGPLFTSGVYFYEMTADGKQISVKKMIMTK